MSEYEKLKIAYSTSIDCSFWLAKAIKDLDERDPVDALHDIEALTQIFEEKWKELTLRKAEHEESRMYKL